MRGFSKFSPIFIAALFALALVTSGCHSVAASFRPIGKIKERSYIETRGIYIVTSVNRLHPDSGTPEKDNVIVILQEDAKSAEFWAIILDENIGTKSDTQDNMWSFTTHGDDDDPTFVACISEYSFSLFSESEKLDLHYYGRIAGFGNPLSRLEITAIKRKWAVNNLYRVDGLDAVNVHGERKKPHEAFVIAGDPAKVLDLMQLAIKSEEESMPSEPNLILKKIDRQALTEHIREWESREVIQEIMLRFPEDYIYSSP